MSILDSCEVVGNLIAAMGDGTDVDGEPLDLVNPPYWTIGNLGQLWVPGDKRGADVLMPGAADVRPYRRRPTVTPYSLPFFVSGDADIYDDEFDPCNLDEQWIALEHNLLYLAENLLADPGTREGTRDSILVMPSGSERPTVVHYLKITPARVESATLTGTLDISVPIAFEELAS